MPGEMTHTLKTIIVICYVKNTFGDWKYQYTVVANLISCIGIISKWFYVLAYMLLLEFVIK